MKRVFILILLICINTNAQKNKQQLDSLEKLLPMSNDSLKVEIFSNLFNRNNNKNPELARIYLDSMRIYSNDSRFPRQIGVLTRNEGSYFARINRYRNSEDSLRKSVKIFEKLNNNVELSYTYNNLGLTLRSLGQLDSAMYYHTKSLKIREKNWSKTNNPC